LSIQYEQENKDAEAKQKAKDSKKKALLEKAEGGEKEKALK